MPSKAAHNRQLEGKTAIVTGASRSIGYAIARALASEGAAIVTNYRTQEEGASELVAAIEADGGKATCFQADFTDLKTVDTFFESAMAFLGGVDIVVNNAGVWDRVSFLEVTEEDLDRAMGVNFKVPMRLCQLAIEHMLETDRQGSIINISSIRGFMPAPRMLDYCCSKAALDMMTRCVALDFAEEGIRINGIAPGVTASGANEAVMARPDLWESRLSRIPMPRPGEPKDYASAAVFLASDASSWMTGQTMVIDGGHTLSSSYMKFS